MKLKEVVAAVRNPQRPYLLVYALFVGTVLVLLAISLIAKMDASKDKILSTDAQNKILQLEIQEVPYQLQYAEGQRLMQDAGSHIATTQNQIEAVVEQSLKAQGLDPTKYIVDTAQYDAKGQSKTPTFAITPKPEPPPTNKVEPREQPPVKK